MSDIRDILDAQHDSGSSSYGDALKSLGDASLVPAQSYQDQLTELSGRPDPYKDDARIRQLLAQASDPQAALDEWEAAKTYGRIYNISPYQIYGSSQIFSKDYFGHVVAPKSVPRTVVDFGKAGIEATKGWMAGVVYALDRLGHSQAGNALGQAFQMGLSGLAGPSVIQNPASAAAAYAVASGGPNAVIAPPAAPASQDMKAVLAYAMDCMKKADELKEDIIPRGVLVKAAQWTANTLPYMGLVAITGAASGGVAAGVAGFAGRLGLSLAKRQTMRAVMAGGMRLASGAALMQGQDFLSFLEAGMDEDTAAWLSLGTGALNGAIEQVIGLEGAVSSMFGKTSIPSLANSIMKKVWVNGGVPSVVGRVALRTGVSMLAEPTEEGLQALVSDTAQMLGQFLDDVPQTEDSMTVSKMANDIAQNMWQALVTAPLLGLLPNTVQALKDTGRAKAWAAAAPSMPKKQAIDLGKASGAFEGVPESEMDSTLGEAYDRLKATATEVALATHKAASEEAAAKIAAGQTVDRTSSGGLRIEASSGEASGLQEGEAMYTAGSASNETRYGDIVVRESGDAFTIIDGDIEEGHEADAVEIINEVAARIGNSKPLLISDEVVDPVVVEAYKAVVESRGVDGAMGAAMRDTGSAEDVAAKERVRRGVRGVYQLDPEAADLVVSFLDMVAAGQGKSFAEVARGIDETSFQSNRKGDMMLEGEGALGKTEVYGEKLKNGAVNAVRSMIYVAQTANFHTLMHEMAHYTRAFALSKDSLSSLEAYYGVKGGAWTDAHEERFAEDLTSYLMDGKAPEPGLKSTFRKIAAMLRRFWEEGLSKAKINPELRTILDSLFTQKEEKSAVDSGSAVGEEVSGDEAVSQGREVRPQREGTEAARTAEGVGASGSAPSELEVQAGNPGAVNLAEGPMKKKAKGKKLNDVEQAILSTAETDAQDRGQKQRELFMKAEAEDAVPVDLGEDMMDYDNFESWVRSVAEGNGTVSEADRAWFKRRWDYLHSGTERKFRKPGDFTRFLAAGSNLQDFTKKLYETISTGARNATDAGRRDRMTRAISKTPELTSIMEEYRKRRHPSDEQKKKLLSYVRKNEAIVKYLYGELDGDEVLADEALSDMKAVPELKKRAFATSPELTLADKASIIKDLGDEALAKKVHDKEATFREMLEYTRLVERKARDLVAEVKSSERSMARERELEIRGYYRARDAARAVRSHMRKLRAFIMQAPARGSMSFEHYKALDYIRDYLSASGDTAQMAIKNLATIAFVTNPELMADTISFLEAFKGRPFEDLTLAELYELAGRVRAISDAGRKEYKETKLAYGLKSQAQRRLALDAVKGSPYKSEIHGEGTEDQKAREQHMKLLHGIDFASIKPAQFVEKFLDGKQGGWNYNKLIKDRVTAERKKWENYDRRTRPVVEFIEKKKLHKGLFDVVVVEGAGVMGQDLRMTASELIGVRCLIGTKDAFNQKQREAYIYGNLFSAAEEKDPDGSKYRKEYAAASAKAEAEGLLLSDYLKANPIQRGDAWMMSQYQRKLDRMLEATSNRAEGGLLSDDQIKLANLMLAATDNKGDLMRWSLALKDLTGKEPVREKWYFPIMRVGIIKAGEDEIGDMLKGGGFEAYQDMGMSIERRNIQPKNQNPVKTDSMRIFFDAIIKQEHLTEMGRYAKELHAVYLNPEFSKGLREQITANLGSEGYNYLKRYIDEATNPMAWKMKDPAGGAVGIVRGAMVMANLAWRLSSFLMQLATSPLPFFFEAPGEMMTVLAEAWTHNPVKWYKSIEEKSGNLKHRQFEPLQIVLEQLSEEGLIGFSKKIGQLGMNPLQFADRFSCAVGWEACHRKKMGELSTDTTKTKAQKDELAKTYADEVVKRTQPTAEDIDRSPLYQDMSSWKQMILQFTEPLNVIWNNVRYDAPMAWKNGHKGKAAGIITVYAITGILVGATQALRGRGPEPDDEGEKDWLMFFLLAAGGQFLEMIPLGGDYAVAALSAAFNNGAMPFRSDQNLPLADEASKVVASIFKPWGEMSDDQKKKALRDVRNHVITVTGLATGLPSRAVVNTISTFEKLAGGDE